MPWFLVHFLIISVIGLNLNQDPHVEDIVHLFDLNQEPHVEDVAHLLDLNVELPLVDDDVIV
jgi:hypothetical protein